VKFRELNSAGRLSVIAEAAAISIAKRDRNVHGQSRLLKIEDNAHAMLLFGREPPIFSALDGNEAILREIGIDPESDEY
jgi:hypothetical protein